MAGEATRSVEEVAASVLALLAGPGAELREGQLEALQALTQPGSRVLVVQATGWGKSAVYWIATAWARRQGHGPTLVVSPLLSLMRDQVAAAARAGLRAAAINSSNVDSWQQIEADVSANLVDVLLVSPERLANPGFGARVLEGFAGRLGLVVIDEAHSVSDWGHDFRPDYRRVTDVLRRLNPATPVLATTATANARVVTDLAAQFGEDTVVLRGPLARSSLQLAVVAPMGALERYAWVVDQLPDLPGSGIIYTLTVADAERLAHALQVRYADAPGLQVAAYTGALDGDDRERLEEDLRHNRVKALVATSALGMGYDKPDLGFVVHVGAPPSPVSYYQQVGRAGRAIDHALVALLPSGGDDGIWDYFATATIPKESQVRSLLDVLGTATAPMSVPALEAETGLRRTRVELLLKQLAVDGVTERSSDGWLATGKTWTYDRDHYDGVLAVRRHEADIMRSYVAGSRCLMQLLQLSLDDPDAAPCGRCSVCLGHLPSPLRESPDAQTVAAVRQLLRQEQHVLEPRKMWPGGAFGARGRIPAGMAAEPGRVLVHADAAEWADLLAGPLSTDGAAPQDLLDACVGVLHQWRSEWASRPTLVVGLPAAGLSHLVSEVQAHLANVGRLAQAPWPIDRPDISDLTSSDEAAVWRKTFAQSEIPQVLAEVVLLVVDESSSGWAVTVAAATLREAGAEMVLPLLIHRRIG
ncbi:RecQ family ATP-dependent DNA helicase [Rudaeicoccus suwonensis]|uniref:DNA 3'-5' helicase n=1 Tax=Rudaeicoccus suwonensis TaxID=657409 RepID=A0A561EAU6_9MICO|nr:DEAD/DEAH box helicase [Rudaeicoccus suwonensis]TWE12732.1 ATP-dependent DNA helicase RecQ [Rudaeicoccus suwonensis]